jgi:hypothetical protein
VRIVKVTSTTFCFTWLRLAENWHRIQFPEQRTVDADTAQRLSDIVATLSPRRQTLLRELFITNPQPYTEVASDTGIPTSGIGPTHAQALTQLRCRLQERGLTNTNAATALFLSVTTIEYHLSSHSDLISILPNTLAGASLFAGRTEREAPDFSDSPPAAASPATVVVMTPAPVVVVGPPIPGLCSHFSFPPLVRKRLDALSSLITTIPRRSSERLVFPANLQLATGIHSELSGAHWNLADSSRRRKRTDV